MALYRILLAASIALGLAMAPMSAALAASKALAMPGMEDCHGRPAKDCPCCDKAICSTELCGLNCHNLLGTLPAPLQVIVVAAAPDKPADPQKPPDRLQRPPPPPPRS